MPGDTTFLTGLSFWGTNLTIAVANGTVPEWRLDDACVRIMSAYYLVGRETTQVPINFDSWTQQTFAPIHIAVESPIGLVNEHVDVRDDHAGLVREIGRASTVLLKNTNNALPLSGNERQVGIFGEDAGSNAYGANGCPDRGCDNGTLAMGWGSGTANFPYLITPEEAIQRYILTRTDGLVYAVTAQGAVTQSLALAPLVDLALVFVNADAGEGYISVDGNAGDRNNLTLWKQGDDLIKNVSALCNNTIVVMHTVGPVLVSDWYDNDNVTAILWAGLPGQESGNAIVDVLYGHYNPGGKLPFTFGPTRESYGTDLLYEPNNGQFGAPQDDFTEGVFIDYRAFDKMNITPIYEFGFGLSYTTFDYSELVVTSANAGPYFPTSGTTSAAPSLGNNASMDYSRYLFPNGTFDRVRKYIYPYLNSTNPADASGDPDYGLPTSDYVPPGATDDSPQPLLPAGGAPGGNPGLWDVLYTVTATITNTGSVQGDEVAQLYVSLGGGEPAVVLRGFDRLTIASGESATFTAQLNRRDLSIWDTVSQNWVPAPGPLAVYVGSSSRNLPLSSDLEQY
jgi:Glycosyl hydrolase family 3 C-terminal domain/Fibronectin type III-like domain